MNSEKFKFPKTESEKETELNQINYIETSESESEEYLIYDIAC